jgi:hypothetical protein
MFPNVFSDLHTLFSITVIFFEFKSIDDKLSTLWMVRSNAEGSRLDVNWFNLMFVLICQRRTLLCGPG